MYENTILVKLKFNNSIKGILQHLDDQSVILLPGTKSLPAITLTGIDVNVMSGYYFMINRINIYLFLIL